LFVTLINELFVIARRYQIIFGHNMGMTRSTVGAKYLLPRVLTRGKGMITKIVRGRMFD